MNVTSLRALRDDLDAALAVEQEPWIRTRLLTLRAMLEGHPPRVAAAMNSVGAATARRWVKRASAGGIAALLTRDHGVRQRNSLLPQLRSDPAFKAAISAALASHPPPYIRNRLLCIQAVLDGAAVTAVARAARGPRTSLLRSLDLFHRGGLSMLLAHTHASPFDRMTNIRTGKSVPRRQFWKLPAAQVEAARTQIAAALSDPSLRQRNRQRLLAIDAALAGVPVGIVANRAQMKAGTIRLWVRKMARGGIDSVIPQPRSRIRPGSVAVTQEEIEAALAIEVRPKIRKRLIALLAVLQGQTVSTAARTANSSPAAVAAWLKRVRTEGLAPLLTPYPPSTRRTHRISNSGLPVQPQASSPAQGRHQAMGTSVRRP